MFTKRTIKNIIFACNRLVFFMYGWLAEFCVYMAGLTPDRHTRWVDIAKWCVNKRWRIIGKQIKLVRSLL